LDDERFMTIPEGDDGPLSLYARLVGYLQASKELSIRPRSACRAQDHQKQRERQEPIA
jgi:hypothetical protein